MNGDLLLREVAEGYGSLTRTIIIACVEKAVLRTLFSHWEWVKLGLVVSRQLCTLPPALRRERIEDIVIGAIAGSPADDIVVENIDLLFAPDFALDVVRLLAISGKNKHLIVHWEGNFANGVLTYAEPGCPDYHRYELRNYDAYCVTR